MNQLFAPLLVAFPLTLTLSFLIGLALREYYIEEEHFDYFGSVRTYTFVGMLGFGLFQIGAVALYGAGLLSLAAFLAIYYWRKSGSGKPGMIGMLTAVLTYLIGPLSLTAPPWFVMLFGVSVLFAVSAKERIRLLSERITQREIVTLATFLTLAGVVLPLLPHETVAPFLPLTPYQIWLAVVVSASISYASYLLHKFAFPRKGLLVGGFLGGLYSSTATTFAISRLTRDLVGREHQIAGALVAPTAMMYFRVVLLSAVFDLPTAARLAPAFFTLGTVAAIAAHASSRNGSEAVTEELGMKRNPLELTSAALFAVLLVAMAVATHYVTTSDIPLGMIGLSVAAGLSDVDALIVSLLQTQSPIERSAATTAIIMAIVANNVLKTSYVLIFAAPSAARRAAPVLLALAAATAGTLLVS